MKTAVITGSARGLGFEMAKQFRKNNFNVVISDLKDEDLKEAKKRLEGIESEGKVLTVVCNVTKEEDLQNLMEKTIEKFKAVDVWINNAGVNQHMVPVWELETSEITRLLDIDLKGAMIGSKIAMNQMIKQGFGQI